MADARPLFYVTAVVLLALVAWVVWIWVRKTPPWAEPGPLSPKDADVPKSPPSEEPRGGSSDSGH